MFVNVCICVCDNPPTQCRCAVDSFISARSAPLRGGEGREGEERVQERRKEEKRRKKQEERRSEEKRGDASSNNFAVYILFLFK